jgi:hypothetical protein
MELTWSHTWCQRTPVTSHHYQGIRAQSPCLNGNNLVISTVFMFSLYLSSTLSQVLSLRYLLFKKQQHRSRVTNCPHCLGLSRF